MKKLYFALILIVLSSVFALAQKVQIRETTQLANGLTYKGFATNIELDNKVVEKAWVKKLKEYGKTESSKNIHQVNVALLPDVFASAVNLFSMVNTEKGHTVLFLSIEQGDNYITSQQPEAENVKKILYDFAINLYRADLNNQIKEAEKAVSQTVKAHEKKVNEGKSLQNKLNRNAEEKIKLEQQLVENAKEATRLKEQIELNKSQQETALEELTKVRKLADAKKTRLTTIQ